MTVLDAPPGIERGTHPLPEGHSCAVLTSSDAVLATPSSAPARTLVEIFEQSVERHQHRIAIDDGLHAWSYAELERESRDIARRLREAGVRKGDRVGIKMASGSSELYASILGVLFAGAAYVPVDGDDSDVRAKMIFDEADCGAVLTDHGLSSFLSNQDLSTLPAGAMLGRPAPCDDAWIIFTSGSTGLPKGVAVSHRSAAAFVDAESGLFLKASPLGPGDRVLAGLSVAFDASCEEIWLAWRSGACLVPVTREIVRSGPDLGRFCADRNITAVSTVPSLATLLAVSDLSRLRLIILGGEVCSGELAARLVAPGREVWNTYGPTEATVVTLAARLREGEPVRIGRPIPGWSCSVVDANASPVHWGETGELVIGGIGLGRYLNPVLDAERFAAQDCLGWDRAYRTGDMVRAEPEGLVFIGRIDDQVKIAGRRIELGELDGLCRQIAGVVDTASALQHAPSGTPVLVSYLVVDRQRFEKDEARAYLAEHLSSGLVPRIVVVDELPLKSSGKLDRSALPWPVDDAAGNGGGEPDLDLGDPILSFLATEWASVLGPVRLTPESDFFSSGGSSFAAAQLVSSLRSRFPSISVADVYRFPTLSGLVGRIAELTSPGEAPTLEDGPPRHTAFVQGGVVLGLFTFAGLRWLLVLAAIGVAFGHARWMPGGSWLWVLLGWVTLASPPGAVVLAAIAARLLTFGLKPGVYRRGGSAHLRLWAAERFAVANGVERMTGTVWAVLYARLLGASIGSNVELYSLPPVSGLAVIDDEAAIESGVDLSGWRIEGASLLVGDLTIGAGASIGARSTLLPGAVIGEGAEVEPGSCVTGVVDPWMRFAGSPALVVGLAGESWPTDSARRSRWWRFGLTAAPFALSSIPIVAAVPSLLVLYFGSLQSAHSLHGALRRALELGPAAAFISIALYAVIVAITIRIASRFVQPGIHESASRTGLCSWVIERLMANAQTTLFPLYASLVTPMWLRSLGATIGRRVEASTTHGLPCLVSVQEGGFLADDTLLAHRELRGGRLRLGAVSVGRRGFVGNSGIVRGGRSVADGSLIGVLSSAPQGSRPGTSWLGMPPIEFPRVAALGDPARTFEPPRRLVATRAIVESLRIVPVLISFALGEVVLGAYADLLTHVGFVVTALLSGLVLFVAGVGAATVTTLAKWLLVGRVQTAEHPLWSPFVWRNELVDVFAEELAVPWFASAALGTPLLNVWLRSLGARIGKGVWCETWWLPEPDLIELGDFSTVNRGCVLQTHLFHDRVMRLGTVRMGSGASLGPHSVALPDSVIEGGAAVVAASLVIRGETIPARTRWLGNPVVAWSEKVPNAAARHASRSLEQSAAS